jgi:hypothetical protein
MFKMVVVSLAFLLFTAACTKQREAQFTTGQGENLLEVSAYDGKTFDIKTGSSIEDQRRNFSKAQTLDVNAKNVGADAFSVVSYEVNDPLAKKLLADTVIVGKRNTTYKGLIKVAQNFVKVYKLAKASDIPLSEATYAEKMADGMLAVPLIGYPVTGRYTIDRVKNEVGEVSSTKYEKGQEDISKASHFRMDLSRGEIFEAVVKTDVVPTSYFTGEWYYNETVTSAPEERSTDLGFSTAYDSTLKPSTRIKFLNDEKTINAVNVNVDERLTQKADVNFKKVLAIPVSWKAYKVTSNGNGMAEKDDEAIHWSKRPYLSLELENAKGAASSLDKSSKRLVNLEISDAYFSFVLEDVEASTRIRYSFQRVEKSNYQAKRLYKEDKRTFGFFETEKSVAQTYENQRLEDQEKNRLISRFNPQKDIVFHFTKTSPQWIRETVRNAVNEWNNAFAAAGAQSRVLLNEEQDVELGDLRYNAINVIENLTSSNLFGFGPSVTDPFTGEIISATTNVHLTPIRESIIQEIKTYIAMKMGYLEQGKLTGIAGQLALLQDMVVKQNQDTLSVASDYFPALKNIKMFVADEKNPGKLSLQNIDFRKRTKSNAKEFDVSIASGNIHQEIEAQCPEIISYIKEIQAAKQSYSAKENEVLNSCSRKMVLPKFAGTLIHEIGHNLGLRHNFMASNDTQNFWPIEKTGGKHAVRSSSVMEYSAFNEDRLVKPGTYDIAAIRFGYADAVLTEDGNIKKLDTRYSITQNLNGTKAHAYKFCTDEDVAIGLDPMCQRHDAGETPLEVVKNIIAEYQASYQLNAFRRDAFRNVSPARLGVYHLQKIFVPLMGFYQQWRVGVARYVGQNDQYLERMSSQEYAEVVAKMAQDPQFKNFVAQYQPVAQEIFNFLTQVTSMSNRYCVLSNFDASDVKIEELNKVRENMYFTSKKTVNNCAEAQKQDAWMGTGFSLVQEIGHHMNTFRYDLSANAILEPYDVIGTEMDRANAWYILTNFRTPLSYDSLSRGFYPSMMDEPGFRQKVKDYATKRVVGGLSGDVLSRYMTANDSRTQKIVALMKKKNFIKFEQEKNLLTAMIPLWKSGIMVPGKQDASLKRADTLSVLLTRQMTNELMESAKAFVNLGSGIWVVATSPDATDAIALINAYKQISGLKNAMLLDDSNAEIKAIREGIATILPANIGSMKLQEFHNHLKKNEKVLMGFYTQETATKYGPVLGELSAILQNLGKLDQIEAEGDEDSKKVVAELKKGTMEEFAKALINKERGIMGLTYVDAMIKANNEAFNVYKLNRADIDAEVDILTTTLMSLQ